MIRVKAELMLDGDLRPGDLFSTLGPDYWDTALVRGSLGERVYIRTYGAAMPDDVYTPIYRLTIIEEK